MDKLTRDNLAKDIIDWESNHSNDSDILNFSHEIVKAAINQALTTNLGWVRGGCGVNYDNESVKDTLTGKVIISIPREKISWIIGLVAFSWLSKVVQGKIDVGHCHTHKKNTGKPCELGKEFHTEITKEIAQNLREMADIVDPPVHTSSS